MNDIDFLPDHYRERRHRVQLWLWRFIVLAGFGFVMGSVATMQFAQYRNAKIQLEKMQGFRAIAQKKSERLAALQTQLAEAQEFADLYTYLNHPWPRTQLLSAIARPLPEAMSLSELSISRASTIAGQRNVAAARSDPSKPEGNGKRPPRVDLERLRTTYDKSVSIVQLAGETRDPTALHSYVAALGSSPLFTAAELESLESIASDRAGPTANFHIRLVVRPGYGQVDGPDQPQANLASTRPRTPERILP